MYLITDLDSNASRARPQSTTAPINDETSPCLSTHHSLRLLPAYPNPSLYSQSIKSHFQPTISNFTPHHTQSILSTLSYITYSNYSLNYFTPITIMFTPYTPNSTSLNQDSQYDPSSVGLLFAQCPKESCLAYNQLIEASGWNRAERGHTRSKSSLSSASEASLSSSSSTSHRRNKSNISQPQPYQGHLKPTPSSNGSLTWQPPAEWRCSEETPVSESSVAKDDARRGAQKPSSLSKILHAVAKR